MENIFRDLLTNESFSFCQKMTIEDIFSKYNIRKTDVKEIKTYIKNDDIVLWKNLIISYSNSRHDTTIDDDIITAFYHVLQHISNRNLIKYTPSDSEIIQLHIDLCLKRN